MTVRKPHLTLPAIDHKDIQRKLVQSVERMRLADVQIQVSLCVKYCLRMGLYLPGNA